MSYDLQGGIGAEHEPGQGSMAFICTRLRMEAPKIVQDGDRGIEQTDLLIEQRKVRLDPHGAGERMQFAGDEFQQRRLAGSVGPDDCHALRTDDRER